MKTWWQTMSAVSDNEVWPERLSLTPARPEFHPCIHAEERLPLRGIPHVLASANTRVSQLKLGLKGLWESKA